MSYTDLFEGYDEVEESHGFDGEPLPTDWYYLSIDKVLDVAQSAKGAITARLQVASQEGPKKKSKAFLNITLSPAAVDKNGSQRTDSEMKAANTVIQAQLKGLLKALGITTSQPFGSTLVEKVHAFYNVASWEGREFIARIQRRESDKFGASNQLSSYYNVADEKRGLDWYRNVHLAKSASGSVSGSSFEEGQRI